MRLEYGESIRNDEEMKNEYPGFISDKDDADKDGSPLAQLLESHD
jgi:hypothetical protein